MTSFQTNGFQFNAFQIGVITGGGPPADPDVLLRTLMGFGMSLLLGMVLLGF